MIKNLKLLRNKYGISQQKLADVIGVSQQSINKYENHDVEPDIYTMIRLAKFFNTSVDYLIGNTDVDCIIEKREKNELNFDEVEVITKYRKLNQKQKESVRLIL